METMKLKAPPDITSIQTAAGFYPVKGGFIEVDAGSPDLEFLMSKGFEEAKKRPKQGKDQAADQAPEVAIYSDST